MSDALLVVEDWISEHYFSSESTKESFLARVKERSKQQREEQKAGHETTRSRFTSNRSWLVTEFARLYTDGEPDEASARSLHAELLRILGYDRLKVTREGPVRWVAQPGSTPGLAIVEARPVAAIEDLFVRDAATLMELAERDGEEMHSASRLVSALFLADDAPSFVLILAGRWLVVAEASRWPEGRYLAVDLHTVAERNDTKQGGEIDRALTCVEAESLAPDVDGEIWWAKVLDDSVKHTVGVSEDLREGVRESIEIIANEVVDRRRARGLPPLAPHLAQPLASQSLRFLYRILFLLYAEASPELKVLPVGDPDYARGYSLDRLRELVQTELLTPRSQEGTHFYQSLRLLFRLVDEGHHPGAGEVQRGLVFEPLKADLFRPEATAMIDEVGLGNRALQRVLQQLLLSKEARGKERGFISYVDLGINQLGAVYEGLMSYSGSFADVDLYEVAHDGDPAKGSWVVPVERSDHLAEKDFVHDTDPVTGQQRRRRYSRGQFVFRLSGRERQRSASYYTPEVLTKFTVAEALAELLDDDTPADDVLALSICEPALGSGAFAIEATRQLAEQYLTRKQAELGRRIDPEDYPTELQRVKAFIALHNVYGVDLNATAVEFAEIALWLDTMSEGLAAPWFGLRLRRGNSLVGASDAKYSTAQVTSKRWLKEVPEAKAGIFHWLLPAEGWGATAESKEAKSLSPDRVKRVAVWRKQVKSKPSKKQVDELSGISQQAEVLWGLALKRLTVAERESARHIPLWGQDGVDDVPPAVSREEIEKSLADPDGAYRRLRLVMDAWCALWFWPLTGEEVSPPTLEQWIAAAKALLGDARLATRRKSEYQESLSPSDEWKALADQETLVLAGAGAETQTAVVLQEHPWLRVCQRVAERQGFFHWQLEFAPVFTRGGFDLQVGNPPWVRPRGDVAALLAEGDPWWMLTNKPSEKAKKERKPQTLLLPGVHDGVLDGDSEIVATAAFLGDVTVYPHLTGLQPDLYRAFMSRTWTHMSPCGTVALIHLDSHFTDEKAGTLRSATYARLRRHWFFTNELRLFQEIGHHKTFGVNIYGSPRQEVKFLNATALYHPETIIRSMKHDGSGEEPGFKYEDRWDRRPHASRVQTVSLQTLDTWKRILGEASTPRLHTSMVYTMNSSSAMTLEALAPALRVSELNLGFSAGWHERADREEGRFKQLWGRINSWEEAILQGPHLNVSTPFFKEPRPTLKNQQDWRILDLETISANALPFTAYSPTGKRAEYDALYGTWEDIPIRNYYRLAWRRRIDNTTERTLMSALIPPGAAHVNLVYSIAGTSRDITLLAAATSSLLHDFTIRAVPKGDIYLPTLQRLPLPPLDHPLIPKLLLRTLRLNCLTEAYAELWEEVWDDSFADDEWLLPPDYPGAPRLGDVGPYWTEATPLRRALDRRNALLEIDVLMAHMLGISVDDLCTIYRTQFAVLHGYDQKEYTFDANGRIVPTEVLQLWRKKGDALSQEERTAPHPAGTEYTYDLPFAPRDREADFREAMARLLEGS